MKKTQTFFDAHAHHHAYRKASEFYVPIAREIQERRFGRKIRILDMGCGDGNFIRDLIKFGIDAEFYGTDLSRSMVDMSHDLVKSLAINLIVADGLWIPFSSEARFDIIHLDSVLHHLISSNTKRSKKLAREMISRLVGLLNGNGLLIVEEMYYDSYFIPSFTSSQIFYSLKVLNYLQLDLSKISRDFVPGLEVNFFEETHLLDMLCEYGSVKILRRSPGSVAKYKRLLLLKGFGHITFVVTVPPNHERVTHSDRYGRAKEMKS